MSELVKNLSISQLTPQQQAAVLSLEPGVAVSAGAGCGKTKVLTERFLHELTGPSRKSVRQVIALTFTEKAARELRDRVRLRCREGSVQGEPEERARYRALRRALEAAPIGTFHSFCGQLLNRFPIESNVEPGTTVLVPTITATLIEQSIERSLRGWLGNADPGFLKLAVRHGTSGLRKLVALLIERRTLCDLETWQELTEDQIVDRWRQLWEQEVLGDAYKGLEHGVIGVMEALSQHVCSSKPRQVKNQGLLDLLPVMLGDDDPATHFEDAKTLLRLTGTKENQWPSPQSYDRIKHTFNGLKQAMKDYEGIHNWDDAVTREQARLGLELARLGVDAIKAFDQQKRNRSLLDFDDLLLLARRLLRHPTEEVRAWVERSAQLVLVDEFQDTDPIQDEIIELLRNFGLADSRLFLVGDQKQSIYRFRGAQPRLFEDRQQLLTAEGRKPLTQNFRSAPEILDFVNYLFADTFPGAQHALSPGPKTPPYQGDERVTFVWASLPPEPGGGDEGDGDGGKKPRKVLADDGRRVEARWLARLIAGKLEACHWHVRDRLTGQSRAATPGDVVILLRTLKDSAPYEAELASAGLDFHVQGAAAFYGQQEVLDVINALTAIEDPYDSMALAATLRSPLGCASDDALYWLGTREPGGLGPGFEQWESIDELSPTDRQAVGRLHRLLAGWRRLKDRLPIARLLDRVLDDTGYEPALLGEFLGDRRRANVRKLVRLARQFDEQGGLTLADFVARLRAYAQDMPREDEAATSEEEGDAVRLMTIHQAKGLEFPVVLLPDLNRGRGPRSEPVAVHESLGVVLKSGVRGDEEIGGGLSLAEVVYKHIDDREEDAELNRLLYVATTRARDYLLLSSYREAGDEKPVSLAMKLLSARFNLDDGTPTLDVERGGRSPVVGVLGTEPKATTRRSAIKAWVPETRRERVAQTLETVASSLEPEQGPPSSYPPPPPPRPWLLLDPAASLDPREARVERLSQALLADPGFPLSSPQLFARAQQLARKMNPVATPGIIREAVARLEAWTTSPLALLIQQHAASSERNARWTHSPARSCLVEGVTEFVVKRDQEPPLVVIVTTAPNLPDWHEQLRLQLAMDAATAESVPRVAAGYRVQVFEGGFTETEQAIDLASIDRLLIFAAEHDK